MEEVKRYECKLSTNGYEVGAMVMLTAAEAEKFNAGEAEPRFVLAEDQSVAEPTAMGGVVATEETITDAPVNPDSEAPATE